MLGFDVHPRSTGRTFANWFFLSRPFTMQMYWECTVIRRTELQRGKHQLMTSKGADERQKTRFAKGESCLLAMYHKSDAKPNRAKLLKTRLSGRVSLPLPASPGIRSAFRHNLYVCVLKKKYPKLLGEVSRYRVLSGLVYRLTALGAPIYSLANIFSRSRTTFVQHFFAAI
jgi:hypothetical protein